MDEEDCKYFKYDFGEDLYYCKIINQELSDELEECINCPNFKPRQCCDDCSHALYKTYETGTIDEIDYFCSLQNNNLIYKDINLDIYAPNWPNCPIGKFQKR